MLRDGTGVPLGRWNTLGRTVWSRGWISHPRRDFSVALRIPIRQQRPDGNPAKPGKPGESAVIHTHRVSETGRDSSVPEYRNPSGNADSYTNAGAPYSPATYIDADTHTAAKCNMCALRVDQDLEPACVVVCPTHSIWVGDLDDPTSGIAKRRV